MNSRACARRSTSREKGLEWRACSRKEGWWREAGLARGLGKETLKFHRQDDGGGLREGKCRREGGRSRRERMLASTSSRRFGG